MGGLFFHQPDVKKGGRNNAMKEKIRTHRFFNLGTQKALYENVGGYVDKEVEIQEHLQELGRKYGFSNVIRMDLGQNNDGCDIDILQTFEKILFRSNKRHYLKNYPDFLCRGLRDKIGSLHGIPSDWILLSAGLDQMLIMIASSFLEVNDRVLVNCPSFFLFEEYSHRMGAIPITLNLQEENGFVWDSQTFNDYVNLIQKLRPKLIWIANPNNPTGRSVPKPLLGEIIRQAWENFSFIVVDEAYGEYIDLPDRVSSASEFLKTYDNLIVLRTFSKTFGLANLRIGYAMVNNTDIMKALKIHRPYYPITQIAYDLALEALNRLDYLNWVREQAALKRLFFMEEIGKIPSITCQDSETCIMMLKHKVMKAEEFIDFFGQNGIIVSRIPDMDQYIRITLGTEENNRYFMNVLREIDARV